jgi:hypothetical protein
MSGLAWEAEKQGIYPKPSRQGAVLLNPMLSSS